MKPPRNVLTPLNGGVRKSPSQGQAERLAAMKERFQRDIDETVAEILAEERARQGSGVAMALGFEGE